MSRQIKSAQLRPGSLSKIAIGQITASVQESASIFLITSASLDLFKVQSDGIIIFATQSAELSNPAPIGGIYFTSSSFFVGLE